MILLPGEWQLENDNQRHKSYIRELCRLKDQPKLATGLPIANIIRL